jgi:outer membrane protein OmpA-like peptidoglycan-associated protein
MVIRFIASIISPFLVVALATAQSLPTSGLQSVNSAYDELNPVLSPDGRTLFLTIANHPQNIGGMKDPGDVWIAILSGTTWTTPVHGGNLINDKSYNAVAGISADGLQLFFLNHFDADGRTVRTQGISVSKYNGQNWPKPENISIPYFQNKSNLISGAITPDKGVFVFSAETYGTKGVEDIYVSLNEDGRWTEPKNIGGKINTQFQELSPSLSADCKTLFFSSNGRKGSGSFDIYYSNRLDDSWSNWSDPINLGTAVNTEGREIFYREYADKGFSIFATTKNSDGYGDIKMYVPDNLKKDTVIASTVKADSSSGVVTFDFKQIDTDNKLVKIHGKVTNSKTGENIDARLVFATTRISNTVTSSHEYGFSIQIPVANTYLVKIEASGYVSVMEKLDTQEFEMVDLEMNFKLQPIEVGTIVNLKNVLFERGSSILLPDSYQELDLTVSFLNANPNVKIELNGHTDNRGVHADNVKLSQDRVNSVKDYLVSKGIDIKRMTGKGYGGLRPIASNDNEETRKLNRRVEFTIKKF